MHAVFRVDEIFTTILNFIYEDCSLTTLTALARTCKTFQDPSLDILWQNQSSLFPILRSLSGAVAQRSVLDGCVVENPHTLPPGDVKRLQHSLYLIREPSYAEWKTFCTYAARIKWLDADYTRDSIDDALLHTLSSQHQLLFPNLRTLIWLTSGDREVSLEAARPFLSRRLTRIYLYCRNSSMDLPLIDFMTRNCLLLKDFYLFCKRSSELSVVLEKLYQRSTNLRVVNCHAPLDTNAWPDLANQPYLRSLTIPVTSPKQHPSSSHHQDLTRFSSLEELHLSTPTFSTLADLLASSSFPKLTTICFDIQTLKILPRSSFSTLVGLVSKSCSPSTLRAVDISSHYYPADDRDPNNTILPDVFRPLLSFNNLQSFSLSARWCYDLDDAIVRDMADAWPKLTYFWLDPTGQWPIPSRITLEGLLPLAEKCADLRTLGIVIHANHSIPFNGVALRPGRGRVNYQLKALMVGNSYITSSYDTAVFLSDIFPNLKRVDSWLECTREEEVYRDRWVEVGKLIQYFARVRMQERNWVQFVHLSQSSHPELAVLPPTNDVNPYIPPPPDTRSPVP